MKFSLLHKGVTYLLSGMGLCALSLGNEVDDGVMALVFFGFVVSWFAEEPLISRPRYASAWNVAVVLFLVVQVMRGVTDRPTLAMAIEFAAFLQISRLFNRRTAVDYQQIAVLAFLHLIAATVLSTTLTYGAIFAGFVIATPWMLALSHLRREIEGNYPPQTDADPAARSAIQRVLSSRRVVGPKFLLGTALLSLPLFAMTLAIFITIPRVGQGFLSFSRDAGQRVAGFGNQVELGGFGVIRDDPTVVLRVMPLPKVDQKAPRVLLRLRGTSFDHYDGRRWTRTRSEARTLARIPPNMYPIRRMPSPESDKQMQIVLEHLEEPVVFLPEGAVALTIPPRISGGEQVMRELTNAPGLDVRYENADGLGLMYTAFIGRDPRESVLQPLGGEAELGYLQVPLGHARVAELAKRVVGDAVTDRQKALRIEHFLKDGVYQYSLEQPDTGKLPPLEVFLLDKQARPLRVLCERDGDHAAHTRRAGAQRDRLCRRSVQPIRRLLRAPPGRRAQLGRGLHPRPRLGHLRPDADQPRRRRTARRDVVRLERVHRCDAHALDDERCRLRSTLAGGTAAQDGALVRRGARLALGRHAGRRRSARRQYARAPEGCGGRFGGAALCRAPCLDRLAAAASARRACALAPCPSSKRRSCVCTATSSVRSPSAGIRVPRRSLRSSIHNGWRPRVSRNAPRSKQSWAAISKPATAAGRYTPPKLCSSAKRSTASATRR